jgi:hypothetical protein
MENQLFETIMQWLISLVQKHLRSDNFTKGFPEKIPYISK